MMEKGVLGQPVSVRINADSAVLVMG